MPDFDSMTETELLRLAITYKNFIKDEKETMFAEMFRERLIQVRIALARKEKAALPSD